MRAGRSITGRRAGSRAARLWQPDGAGPGRRDHRADGNLRRPTPVRRPAALGAVSAVGLIAVSCLLAGCSGGTTPAADSTPHVSPSAPKTYTPAEGPTEAASQLPATCDQILSESALSTAFGTTLSTDDDYGNYAPLPSIGRTGRVTCGFGIGIDEYGNATAPAVTVSIATYDTETDAVARAQDTVGSDLSAGASSSQVSVSGHPATVVVEPDGQSTAGSSTPTPSTIPTNVFIPLPGVSVSASAAASPSASGGGAETELVMADGNRTFVVEIPFTQVSGNAAVTILEQLTAAIYTNTLPNAGSAAASASG
jgi:hypothetical protein